MRNYPYTEVSANMALIAVPTVFFMVWLFNAHRMGKIGKTLYRLGMIGGILLLLLAAVWILNKT